VVPLLTAGHIIIITLQAVGDQFGTLVETVVSICVAVLISFAVNWLLTLVIVVFVPIMVGAGLLQLLVLALHATHYKNSTEEALKVHINCHIHHVEQYSWK
jgi:ABC-type bacteriocin/lantibiotic exporter with double-glycine peptidase domain